MIEKYTSFYFSLDEILDTRAAVLDMINHEATLELLMNKYHERVVDDWETLTDGKIKNEDFKKIYSTRNKEVLKHSRISNFIPYISGFINDAENMFGYNPTINPPKIYLNIFPYTDLTEEELKDIKNSISYHCKCLLTQIEFCCYDQKSLTPNLIKNDFSFTFMYNFEEWKNKHIEAIGKQELMGVYINAPKLYISEIPEEEVADIGNGLKMSAWQATEMAMLPFMVLNLVPANIFSIYKPE